MLRITKRLLKRIRSFVKQSFRKIGAITRYFEKEPCIIMWIDGGFCSQIFRYLKGQWFAVRGFKVKYDISWYDNNPLDCLGIERRDFLLLKCFPHINFTIAEPHELRKYRYLYATNIHNTGNQYRGHYEKLRPPLYNFLYDLDDLISSEKEFEELAAILEWDKLHDMLCTEAKKIERSIIQDKQQGLKVIGLHVRRGDMSVPKYAYENKVLTSRYYEYVVNIAADNNHNNSVVYIFSNGFDFVESDVVPRIKCKYILVNKTSEVYEEMFLCSLCSVIIAGQGSLTKQAYSFGTDANRKLICPVLSESKYEKLAEYYAEAWGGVLSSYTYLKTCMSIKSIVKEVLF